MKKMIALVALAFLAACTGHEPHSVGSMPTVNADFDHNTLALTWQPGFCSVGGGCLADQPLQPLIGLHGLWASEPHSLEARNVPVTQWWKEGCDLLGSTAAPPALDGPMRSALAQIVPHTQSSLIDHEWMKHGACFGYSPGPFFAKASALRMRLARSPLGFYLGERAGMLVSHDAVLAFFNTATGNTQMRALQLQCGKDHEGRVVLTQLWFTLDPRHMDRFPAAVSYMPSPQNQDNCPATFWLRRW